MLSTKPTATQASKNTLLDSLSKTGAPADMGSKPYFASERQMNPVVNSVSSAPAMRADPATKLATPRDKRAPTPRARRRRSSLYAQVVASNALVVTFLIFVEVMLVRGKADETAISNSLFVVTCAIAASLLLNIVLLSRQFRPLDDLVETMEEIDVSQPGARASTPEHATEDIAELFETFNGMIERLELERRRRAAAAVRAQEAERARVARDLHDEANQALTAVLLRLEAATHNAPPDVANEIREAKALAGQAIEELLEVSRRLRPMALDLGLKNALQALCDRINDTSDVSVTFTFEGDARALDDELELAIYRIAQEALNNVLQHSGATSADVRFTADRPIALEIADNGEGFDPERPTSRYGVAGMRERALLVDGTLDIYSDPGRGATVRLEIA